MAAYQIQTDYFHYTLWEVQIQQTTMWYNLHFQRRINKILANTEGAVCLIDDVLSEHDQWLITVLRKLSEAGLTLNKEKCIFNATSIKFLGKLVDNTGMKADPDKIRHIQA